MIQTGLNLATISKSRSPWRMLQLSHRGRHWRLHPVTLWQTRVWCHWKINWEKKQVALLTRSVKFPLRRTRTQTTIQNMIKKKQINKADKNPYTVQNETDQKRRRKTLEIHRHYNTGRTDQHKSQTHDTGEHNHKFREDKRKKNRQTHKRESKPKPRNQFKKTKKETRKQRITLKTETTTPGGSNNWTNISCSYTVQQVL